MSSAPSRPRALSGGPLEGSDTPSDSPPQRERYQDAGRLGRGGMGEVRATVDRRLDREVALKVAHGSGDRARLEREAALTARLEHPGIVPVYDAGTAPDGRPFYTMRLLRGRSLAHALAQAPDTPARLRLVRRVLDAAQAVAYAHDQGVIHRDLKPENVMLGQRGETVVVDWGLAVALDEEPADGAAGTPAYMAPEQALGEPAGRASDVFALGGVLYAALTGLPPRDPEGARRRPLRAVAPEVPADLAAIVDRALSRAIGDRYPDAGAMAEDLLAWFEGRQVAAHDYTPLELLGRLMRAYRLPLAVAAIAAVGLAAAVAAGVASTLAERDRALAAESEALVAKQAADASLARSLVAQAVLAADAGDRASAEILAAHALRFGEDPHARGILARFGDAPRPRLERRVPLQGCERVALDRAGQRVACLQDDRVLVYRPSTGPAPIAERAATAWSAAFLEGGDRLALAGTEGIALWSLATGEARALAGSSESTFLWPAARDDTVLRFSRGKLSLLFADGRPEAPLPRCPSGGAAHPSLHFADGSLLVACSARGEAPAQVLRVGADGRYNPLVTLSVADGPVSALAADPERPERLALGTESGLVLVHDAALGTTLRRPTGLPGVHDLALAGDRLAIAGSQGGVEILDLAAGVAVTTLPSAPARLRWLGGATLRVVDHAISDWAVPALAWPHRFDHGSGVSAVAVSPDGRWIGSAHGDGSVRLRDRASGAAVMDRQLHHSVTKDLAFSPTGDRLAAGSALGDAVLILDPKTGETVERLPTWRTRRLVWSEGGLFVAPYSYALTSAHPDGARRSWPVETQVRDLAPVVGGRELVVLEDRGRVWRLDPEAPDRPVGAAAITAGLAVAGDLDWTYVALPRGVLRLDDQLREIARQAVDGADLQEIALSPDRRWLALGHRDGAITLLEIEGWRRAALLRGHTGRVVALAFTPDGGALISGSWDGSVRAWDLGAIEAPAPSLIGPIERAWGADLAETLQR